MRRDETKRNGAGKFLEGIVWESVTEEMSKEMVEASGSIRVEGRCVSVAQC